MQVLSSPFPLPSCKTVVALGCFDGIHSGHAALLAKTVELASRLDATPAVYTFSDFLPQKGAPLSTLEKRLAAMEAAGIQTVFLSRFEEVRALSPDAFISEILKKRLCAAATVCGFNYRFGAEAKGNGDTLLLHFPDGIQVPAVMAGGAPVSSTRIRSALSLGQVEEAASLLGRPYAVIGAVSHGKSLGHSFGYPTANMAVSTLLPAYGVYETRVTVDGQDYVGLSDVGIRPTLEQDGEERVESFLLDFKGDLYGKTLTVSFLHRLRDEMRFDSAAALAAQIARDVEAIKNKQR